MIEREKRVFYCAICAHIILCLYKEQFEGEGAMVSCLILYHTSITNQTKIMILRDIFFGEDFEIGIVDNSTVVIYTWNVKKVVIWQVAFTFESTNIKTGYGFDGRKADAWDDAMRVLNHPQHYQHINEVTHNNQE